MKKALALILSLILLTACPSCGGGEAAVPDVEPQLAQMKSICELAVMDCYYHNVAKFKEEDAAGFLFWKKDKHFWIEYSGIVTLGIDASQVSMEIQGDTVRITIPEAEVQACTVDSASLTEDSFIVGEKSAEITAEDERAAFAEAQNKMRDAASGDRVLLSSARQRAQLLLENYVRNIGAVIDRDYSVVWVLLDGGSAPPAPSESEPAPAGESGGGNG